MQKICLKLAGFIIVIKTRINDRLQYEGLLKHEGIDFCLTNWATLLVEETPAVTQHRVHPTLWTTWVWICLNMFNAWHTLILSQQASDRRQLTGGGRVQNQLSQQVEDFHADIMTEKKMIWWKDKFTLSRFYIHIHISPIWCLVHSGCCFEMSVR